MPKTYAVRYEEGYHVYIGIDPGKQGGLVALHYLGSDLSYVAKARISKMSYRDILTWLKSHQFDSPGAYEDYHAVIEKVSGYIGRKHPGSRMFEFGRVYGALLMALTAAEIPYQEVTPQRWQKAMGIFSREKHEGRGVWKKRLKEEARKRFPRYEVTLATADAFLIAEYCRLLHYSITPSTIKS